MRVGIGLVLFLMLMGLVPRTRTNGDGLSPPLPLQGPGYTDCATKKCK